MLLPHTRRVVQVLTDPHTGKALVIANQSRNVRSNIKRSVNSAVRAAYRSLAAFFIDLRPKWSTVNCEYFFVLLFLFSIKFCLSVVFSFDREGYIFSRVFLVWKIHWHVKLASRVWTLSQSNTSDWWHDTVGIKSNCINLLSAGFHAWPSGTLNALQLVT